MASIVLKVQIFRSLKKKQTSQARRTGKATVSDCGFNCACVSLISKPVLNNTKEINESKSYFRQKF